MPVVAYYIHTLQPPSHYAAGYFFKKFFGVMERSRIFAVLKSYYEADESLLTCRHFLCLYRTVYILYGCLTPCGVLMHPRPRIRFEPGKWTAVLLSYNAKKQLK